jgi:RNA binding exosome subunit
MKIRLKWPMSIRYRNVSNRFIFSEENVKVEKVDFELSTLNAESMEALNEKITVSRKKFLGNFGDKPEVSQNEIKRKSAVEKFNRDDLRGQGVQNQMQNIGKRVRSV